MGMLCGSNGGWTRLAYLDMSDATNTCPSDFRLCESDGVRACGRRDHRGGKCDSAKYPSHGIGYQEVCGRVKGYEYGSPDAVEVMPGEDSIHNDINSHYVDGVSITRSQSGSGHKHIWTLMAGRYQKTPDDGNCVCNFVHGAKQQIQKFIGRDYYCESGVASNSQKKLHTEHPLWEGNCSAEEKDCCSANGSPPWFHKTGLTVSQSADDFLEIRICGDERKENEDVPVGFYEIYVK